MIIIKFSKFRREISFLCVFHKVCVFYKVCGIFFTATFRQRFMQTSDRRSRANYLWPCTHSQFNIAKDPHTIGLKPSCSAAHKQNFLPLLSSDPDGVRNPFVARDLALNIREYVSAMEYMNLVRELNPAIADCGLQGTAISPSSTANIFHRFDT